MRYISSILPQASGSLGGMVWSHNAGGNYIRARATPTDPGTSFQTTIRNAVAGLVNHWVNTLTVDQRAAWNTYAANVTLPDVFGDARYRSGINHYVRSNTPRLQTGLARVDDGPTIFNVGEYTTPTITASAAAQEISVGFDNTDDWANETGSGLIAWSSRPQNPTIDFFKGPYRHIGRVSGVTGDPPASPAAIATAFAFSEGHRVYAKLNVSRADGRLGTVVRTFCLAAA